MFRNPQQPRPNGGKGGRILAVQTISQINRHLRQGQQTQIFRHLLQPLQPPQQIAQFMCLDPIRQGRHGKGQFPQRAGNDLFCRGAAQTAIDRRDLFRILMRMFQHPQGHHIARNHFVTRYFTPKANLNRYAEQKVPAAHGNLRNFLQLLWDAAQMIKDATMNYARLLPAYLIQRFQGWRATAYNDNKAWYRRLAEGGQHPRAMVISCCDSRVHVTSIFGADEGEFFIHRNVANLVPPYNPDGEYHGTSAAVEYAVTGLKVAHIVVLGHSNCGGVKGCYDMCSGHAPELEEKSSFVGRWMDILRPGFQRVAHLPQTAILQALEKQAVLVSLENLMSFPFVREAVEQDRMTIHGLWTNTGEGELHQYDPATATFVTI